MKFIALGGVALLVAGCGSNAYRTAPDPPKFPAARAAQPGDAFREQIVDASSGRRVWLYPPAKGAKPKGLIVIAPAGSNLITGMMLGDGDRPEHLPFVQAGYAVVAYDVTGPMPEADERAQMESSIRAFAAREAGILDGVEAIDAGIKAFPDAASNVIAVGHSSAATLALGLAAHDKRVKKCVAFAPATDILKFVGAEWSKALSKIPDVYATFERQSPDNFVPKLKKPTFLFVAQDDRVVSAASIEAYAKRLQVSGTPVKLVMVESGDHYDAMIQQGQPLALAWLSTDK